MAYTKLKPRHTKASRVEEISRADSHFLLSIPAGNADRYRLAQLDDYTQKKRRDFPLRDPISLTLSARASSASIPGTWGFGLWNDPFGFSLEFGGNPWRLPALPNAAWFFGASEESYLSFRAPRAEQSDEGNSRSVDEAQVAYVNRSSSTGFATNAQPSTHTVPKAASLRERERYIPNGFLAQTFRSPKFHPLLILAGLALPFSRKLARRLLGQVIEDEGVDLRKDKQLLVPTKVTDWHRYRLDWRENRVAFEVDDALVFESSVSPHPPLGLVIWIDNQYAAFTPEGRIGFGVLENPEPAWLEVKDIEVQ